MPKKKQASELRVVFDSNAIWTQEPGELLPKAALQLIRNNNSHVDLKVLWYIPDVVRLERQFQMERRSLELLPTIHKLEKVIGHKLDITDDIIKMRVKERLETQLAESNIEVLALELSKIDWQRILLDSVFRKPPFQINTEKGFRDALIVEAFNQLVEDSPKTPKLCRVVLVSGDQLLRDAATTRAGKSPNVRIIESLEELQSLISTLVSEVTEEFVDSIIDAVGDCFFDPNNQTGLFYTDSISQRIREEFGTELNSRPATSTSRENGTWRVWPPRFEKKQGQRVFWVSRIKVEAEAYKYTPEQTNVMFGINPNTLFNPNPFSITNPGSITIDSSLWPYRPPSEIFQNSVTMGGLTPPPPPPSKTLVANGFSAFDVQWSVLVTTGRKLRSPKLETIHHVETSWS